MQAIDTNVLLRVLVDDPTAPEQNQLARDLLAEADSVWVSLVVLVETVWVLESAYRFDASAILSALEAVITHPGIDIEAYERIDRALSIYSDGHTDFADCLILAGALERRLTLHTFDRKLARLHGAKTIGRQVS
jgi:predicted nucleic-acid-binding protein